MQFSHSIAIKKFLFIITSLQISFLFHVVVVGMIWGTKNYEKHAVENASVLTSLYHSMGVLSGPQFLRIITTSPERCTEDIWLGTLVIFVSCPVVFSVLMGCGYLDDSTTNRNLFTTSPKNIDQASYEIESLKNIDSNNVVDSSSKRVIRLLGSFVCSLLLQTMLSLVLPMKTLDSDAKSSCAVFDIRFGIRGYSKEYVDTVLIFANLLMLACAPFSKFRLPCLFGVGLAFSAYVVIWLSTECSYTYFLSIAILTYLSWKYLFSKLSIFVEYFVYT